MAADHDKQERPVNKPQLTDADKVLPEAELDWVRMGQEAKRLLDRTKSELKRTERKDK